jgi:hypothetical protein
MNRYLFNLDSETKYTNEDRIWFFKEILETDRTDMKIAKILKSYFMVSMTHVDNKWITVFQVSNDNIEPANVVAIYEDDEFEEPIEGIKTKITTKKTSIH